MNLRRVVMAVVVAGFVAPAGWTEDTIQEKQRVTVIQSDVIEKIDWKNCGFQTPQDTVQTWMWATREENVGLLLTCFDSLEGLGPFTEEDRDRMKEVGAAATGFQPLEIREIDEDEVELKFRGTGFEDAVYLQKLKRVDGKWKLDSSSNTTVVHE